MNDPGRVEKIATEALASAALTVEWLRRLLAARGTVLPPTERLAFVQLLYDKGVVDEAGLLYVQRDVRAEQDAAERFADRFREAPNADRLREQQRRGSVPTGETPSNG